MKCLCIIIVTENSAERGRGIKMTLWKHEIKMNMKSLLIWSLCVGILCFGCLMIYEGLEEDMAEMSELFANMGEFSTALGMDKISIGTIEGFYATEIGLMFAIGGAMFAAMTGAVLLSKEEEGHTSEFLNTLPLGRNRIVIFKYLSLLTLIVMFNAICILFNLLGFLIMKGEYSASNFFLFHGAQLLMHIEIGSICFFLSALFKRKQIGMALGIAMIFYAMDLMCRIMPDIEGLKYVTPYYFSNAADIFTSSRVEGNMVIISVSVTIVMFAAGLITYKRRDLTT